MDGITRARHDLPFKTLLIAVIRHLHLHEGVWELCVEFGISAAKINLDGRLSPAAFVPIVGMSVVQVDTVTDLSVDAAIVNPQSSVPVQYHRVLTTKARAR